MYSLGDPPDEAENPEQYLHWSTGRADQLWLSDRFWLTWYRLKVYIKRRLTR
jgi:hypothetical protein